jgi:D-aminopeptidase
MRVMIWVDAEGISGVTSWEQVLAGRSRYDEGRRLMTQEVNAAVRGAKLAGADEIVVVDSHGAGGEHSFRNLIPELLETGRRICAGRCLDNLHAAPGARLRRRHFSSASMPKRGRPMASSATPSAKVG